MDGYKHTFESTCDPCCVMGIYFVDFEAFQHGDESFQVKELCIIDIDRPLRPLYILYAPKISWAKLSHNQKMTYLYQTHNLHHLDYNEGYIDYSEGYTWQAIMKHFPMCRNHGAIFYIMGKQKMEFMKKSYPQLNWCEYHVTLNNLPLLPRNISCLYRTHNYTHCACLKTYRLYQHYIDLPL